MKTFFDCSPEMTNTGLSHKEKPLTLKDLKIAFNNLNKESMLAYLARQDEVINNIKIYFREIL